MMKGRKFSATENTEATEFFWRIFLCGLCALCGKNPDADFEKPIPNVMLSDYRLLEMKLISKQKWCSNV
jgi:hypothetical protein